MSAIKIEAIRKEFKGFTAVKDVSFEVAEGRSFGLLGPNGAGKTTLIRMLTTLIIPTRGTAFVAGYDVRKNPDGVRKSIGVIAQAMTSDPDLTAAENLNFYARLYGISGARRRALVEELLVNVDLWEWRNKLVGTFSGGMRRRLEIGRSLLHQPKILFLDEPTTGLDPAYRLATWKMIARVRAQSELTLFLTTHYMEEADHLCDQIAILDRGEMVALDTPSNLKSRVGETRLIEISFESFPDDWEQCVSCLPGVDDLEILDRSWRIDSDDCMNTVAALFEAARTQGVTISSLAVKGTTLEDVFVRYTGRELRDVPGQSFRREIRHLYQKGPGN